MYFFSFIKQTRNLRIYLSNLHFLGVTLSQFKVLLSFFYKKVNQLNNLIKYLLGHLKDLGPFVKRHQNFALKYKD